MRAGRCAGFLEPTNPRHLSCLRCGRLPERCAGAPRLLDRDVALERYLTALAAQAARLPVDTTLDDFADVRAHPGGVRVELVAWREAAEELADARNYCVWGIIAIWDRMQAGESEAVAEYEELMEILVGVRIAWRGLRRRTLRQLKNDT